MRKLVLGMSVSADGFVCGPNHETEWLMRTRDEAVKDWIERSLWEGGVHIMGRKTFEVMGPVLGIFNGPAGRTDEQNSEGCLFQKRTCQ